MRNNVTFTHSAEFVPLSDADGVLSVDGASWFIEILRNVPGLSVLGQPCQEDWGAAVFVSYDSRRFWVGLSAWHEPGSTWLAHFHHGSFDWLQGLTSSGKASLSKLLVAIHSALAANPQVSMVTWYREHDMRLPSSAGTSTPDAA